jgi:hypothetical protein
MIRLPELFRSQAGAGDERAGNAEADKKFAPADGVIRQQRGTTMFRCAHFNC